MIQASLCRFGLSICCRIDPFFFSAEPTPERPSPSHKSVTYANLYHTVHKAVLALKSFGIVPGDRVASYSSNCIVCLQVDQATF